MLKEVKIRPEESLDTFHYPSSNQQQQQKDVQYKAPSISDDEVEKLLSGLPEVVLSNVLKEWRKSVSVRHGKNAITNEDIASIIRKLTIMIKENGDETIRNIDLLFNLIITHHTIYVTITLRRYII